MPRWSARLACRYATVTSIAPKYSSTARRTLLRARWSSTRWLPSETSSAAQTSSDGQPSMSRRVITVRCAGGSDSTARRMQSRVSPDRRPSSGVSQRVGPSAQWCGQRSWSAGRKRLASTGSSGSSASLAARLENGRQRPSRVPRVIAMLVRILKIQVFREERPSKPSSPCSTASHVSCTSCSSRASGSEVSADSIDAHHLDAQVAKPLEHPVQLRLVAEVPFEGGRARQDLERDAAESGAERRRELAPHDDPVASRFHGAKPPSRGVPCHHPRAKFTRVKPLVPR